MRYAFLPNSTRRQWEVQDLERTANGVRPHPKSGAPKFASLPTIRCAPPKVRPYPMGPRYLLSLPYSQFPHAAPPRPQKSPEALTRHGAEPTISTQFLLTA